MGASTPPTDLDTRIPDARLVGRRALLTAADTGAFCGVAFDGTAPLHTPLTGLVYCATSAGTRRLEVALPKAKPRRPCRFAPLNDHLVVAARLGFTDAAVLRAAPKFLTGVGKLGAPAGYVSLGESTRLAAGRARPLRNRFDGDSQAIVDNLGVGG